MKLIGRNDIDKDYSEQNFDEESKLSLKTNDYYHLSKVLLEALGGKENIKDSFHCVTRLRVEVNNPDLINEDLIRSTNVAGIFRPSKENIQIIIGPQVENVYKEFEKFL